MRFVLLIVLAFTAGCASSPSVLTQANMPVVQDAGLPPPSASDLLASSRPYLVGPFDTLSIDVFGIPELSREQVQADASGSISVPLVGNVSAAGKTPDQLAREIDQMLRGQYVRNPQVSVNLVETVSQVVTVDGQVIKPGVYPVVGNMTLVRAVATAGGLSEFADLRDVVVFRTVNGQRMAGLYNIDAIRSGAYDDPQVYANDTVIVGNSESRRLFKDLLQTSPLLSTPLLILFRNN